MRSGDLPRTHAALHTICDWLRRRVRAARLRAQAERALPRSRRWRRWLLREASGLLGSYLLLNLLLSPFLCIVIQATIECHIVDAVTGAPIPDALVSVGERGLEATSDRDGHAMLVMRGSPVLWWALPSIGRYKLDGLLTVTAANYGTAELPLPAVFDWPLFGEPHVVVQARLRP